MPELSNGTPEGLTDLNGTFQKIEHENKKEGINGNTQSIPNENEREGIPEEIGIMRMKWILVVLVMISLVVGGLYLMNHGNSRITQNARIVYMDKNGVFHNVCTAWPSDYKTFETAGHCVPNDPNSTFIGLHVQHQKTGDLKLIPAEHLKIFLHSNFNYLKKENDLAKIKITTEDYSEFITPYSIDTLESDSLGDYEVELWRSEEFGDIRTVTQKVKTFDLETCRARFDQVDSVQKAIDRAIAGEVEQFVCIDLFLMVGNSGGPLKFRHTSGIGSIATISLGGKAGTNFPTLCVAYSSSKLFTEIV